MPRVATLVLVMAIVVFASAQALSAQTAWRTSSPDGRTTVTVRLTAARQQGGSVPDRPTRLRGSVDYEGEPVLSLVLAIARKDQAFATGLSPVEAGAAETIDETYTMLHGKQRVCRNRATQRTLVFRNADGAKIELIVRAYDDGVAFRYRFPDESDKQNVILLYHDILRDAADFQIMVNFHGCTLPRGWSRTYPHLMSMEAVRGEECYSFDRRFAREAPVHNTIIPFTRNAVGPMDYTPVMFEDNVYPHLTTYTHELALPLVFESGWLHFADGVQVYLDLPQAPKEFLREVPVAWDETRCPAGAPGEYIVLAPRSGTTWYLGGINGLDAKRTIRVPLSFLGGGAAITLIENGASARTFAGSRGTVRPGDRPGRPRAPVRRVRRRSDS